VTGVTGLLADLALQLGTVDLLHGLFFESQAGDFLFLPGFLLPGIPKNRFPGNFAVTNRIKDSKGLKDLFPLPILDGFFLPSFQLGFGYPRIRLPVPTNFCR
jgi:hypothetical protein